MAVTLPNKQRLLAWMSLLLGIASAVLMDRRPERAWLVMLAIVAGWIGVVAFAIVGRINAAPTQRVRLWRFIRLASRMLAFGPVQFALFFTLPFYWRAFASTLGQTVFLVLLITAALLTLWDPWHEAVAKHPWGGALLQALATFAATNALLPIFGLANGTSLWLAALSTCAIAPIVTHFTTSPDMRQRRALVLSAALPLLALTPPVLRAVPAAPLRLVSGGLGTTIDNHNLIDAAQTLSTPSQLACLSHVWAPRGLKDALVHVWKHNGVVVDHIPIVVRGGRESGFRTWSQKKNLGAAPAGTWTCVLETGTGQLLGEHSVVVR